jgi:hypothetical protein
LELGYGREDEFCDDDLQHVARADAVRRRSAQALGIMPKHLLVSCLLYIAARGSMAVLAPLYEKGVPQYTSPILMLLFIGVSILFMRRVQWTWKFTQWIAFTEIVINALFFPKPEFHGAYTDPARLLVATIMIASCVILWSLVRLPKTKSWFVRT